MAAIGCIAMTLAGIATVQAQQTDNAALLYYQTFLLYEKPDATMERMLADFRAGTIASNETIREHLNKNRQVIEYVVRATNIPHCDWGYEYSQGFELTLASPQAVRRITSLILSEAALQAEQGEYRTALDRCMAAYKMSRDAVDKPLVTYLIGIGTSGVTNRMVERVLETMPGDVEALNRLKTQLNQVQTSFPSMADALTQEAQVCAMSMQKDGIPGMVRILEQDDPEFAQSEIRTRLLAGDDAFFERNRTHWFNSIGTLAATVQSELPYAEVYAKLGELDRRISAESKANPDATLTAISLPAEHRVYMLATRLHTHFNVLQVAIDLYVAKARTGRLPDSLPAGSPPDLFSGMPFEYEKTTGGFILRCRVKEDPEKAQANQYEFKVKQ
ncbi:MAG: hypothetical protein ABFE13_17405 [Phycisphaerales bacterium]